MADGTPADDTQGQGDTNAVDAAVWSAFTITSVPDPATGPAPLTVRFVADNVAALPALPVEPEYHWNFGDGSVGTGKQVTHAFQQGAYTVTLSIVLGLASFDCAKKDVAVQKAATPPKQAPVASAGPDQTVMDADGDGSEVVTLDGSGSTDPDGRIVNYRWTDGGSVVYDGQSAKVVAPFAIGTHVLTLVVTDNGGQTGTDTTAVAVNPKPVGVLAVTPAGDFDTTGPEGGPFTPATMVYTLTNTGGSAINWTVSNVQPWVSLLDAGGQAVNGGTLDVGASTTVAVSIDPNANGLAAGTYNDTVTFTNTTNGSSSTSRGAALTVYWASRIIVPGSGFGGELAQPDPVGSGVGFDEMVIARWDAVQRQTFSEEFIVGVVAFHINGIDHVQFSANGGPWVLMSEMSENPQTGVWEYWAILRAADVPDGPIELRAIACPVVGVPRVLQDRSAPDIGDEKSLWLIANAGGSMTGGSIYVSLSGDDTTGDGTAGSPYGTIQKALNMMRANSSTFDGGTVILMDAGDYVYTQPSPSWENTRWVTVRSAVGLTRADVKIKAPVDLGNITPNVTYLKCESIKVDFDQVNQFYKQDTRYLWFQDCYWYQSQGWAHWLPPPNDHSIPVRNTPGTVGAYYATDSMAEEMAYGFVWCNFSRNNRAHKIGGDSSMCSLVILNYILETSWDRVIWQPGPGGVGGQYMHPDLNQYYGTLTPTNIPWRNVIVYGMKCIDIDSVQNYFLNSDSMTTYDYEFRDMAFVNIVVQNKGIISPAVKTQLYNRCRHVLWLNCSNPGTDASSAGQYWCIRNEAGQPHMFTPSNVRFVNCVFQRIYQQKQLFTIPENVSFLSCHFIETPTGGDDYTRGNVWIEALSGSDAQFTHEGPGARALVGSGAVMPGFKCWKWTTQPDRGAFPFRRP